MRERPRIARASVVSQKLRELDLSYRSTEATHAIVELSKGPLPGMMANRLQHSLPDDDFDVHPDLPFALTRERRSCVFLDERTESLDDLVPLVGDEVEVPACLDEALRLYLPDLFAALPVAANEPGSRESV